MSKIIGIHQPNYLPWLGYFYKISLCDIFIFHDNVELTKKGYTRRTNIRKGNTDEKVFLTVPLKKHSDFISIKDLEIANQAWQQKHINKLHAAYSKTPFFKEYKIMLEKIYNNKFTSLSKLNVEIIKSIADSLKLKTAFFLSSELPVGGKGNEYNLNLCKHFEATQYASGKGAKNYQDETAFQKHGIEIVYNDLFSFLKAHPYTQHETTFIPGLSIVDALFNIGSDGVLQLFKNYENS